MRHEYFLLGGVHTVYSGRVQLVHHMDGEWETSRVDIHLFQCIDDCCR